MSGKMPLDDDNPWPGLESYPETGAAWFKGRDEETGELFRLVERERLSVLYGRSGLGKTSLVQAGLFPRLRRADYLPVRVHLVLAEGADDLRRQIGRAIAGECSRHQVEAPAYDGASTLWEYFFRKECEFWSPDDRLLTPLLVFDQFEEIFTLGREKADQRERCDALLAEIGELVENRRPAGLRERIESAPEAAAMFDERRSPPKILLSFREEYLPDFDILYEFLRARTRNRLRLLPMTGAQAHAAIITAGSKLVSPDAAARIVQFIDPGEHPLEERVIEPALLSLVCSDLNQHRRQNKQAQISTDLLSEENVQGILDRFYDRSFSGLDLRVRDFVEDRLLTATGFRDTCDMDNALAVPGVTPAALQALVDRHLLRREERGGRPRIELIHDVLTQVVGARRAKRREQEALAVARRKRRRQAKLVITLAMISTLFAFLALFGWVSWQRAETESRKANSARTRADAARQQAEELINFMTFTMRDKLKAVGRLDLMNDVLQAVERYHQKRAAMAESSGEDDLSDAELRRRSVSFNNLGDILVAQGNLPEAEKHFRQAMEIAEALAARDPDNAAWQRDLSVSHNKLGDFMKATGKLPEAEKHFRQAMKIREALA